MSERLYILACGYFSRDVKAALALEGEGESEDIKVIAFPPDCGRPPLSWEHIAELTAGAGEASEILVLGSICIAGAGGPPPALPPTRMVHLEQCFHLICPPAIVNDAMMNDNYLLSPGWLAGWHKQVKEWGFDKAGTQLFLTDSMKKLLLLDTGVDNHSKNQLQEFSGYVGLPAESLPVGLDYLRLLLRGEIERWRQTTIERKEREDRKQASNYAMSLDLLAQLSRTTSESEVVDGIFELFTMLFAPGELLYIPYSGGKAGKVRAPQHMPVPEDDAVTTVPQFEEAYSWCEGDNGFYLRLERRDELLGILKVNLIALPQYKEAYLNQALSIISVCALVIDNARTLRQLVDTAHMAGKAELAIDVLHNVGNVLNSVNVGTQAIMERLRHSVSTRYSAVAALIDEHHNDLGEFISHDPRGQKLPDFFSLMSQELEKEHSEMETELKQLANHVNHIKGVIRAQQVYSREVELLEPIDLEELLDEVLSLYADKLVKFNIEIKRSCAVPGVLELPKHKLLQIIGNLISNAIEALAPVKGRPRQINVRITKPGPEVAIEVEDNGIGISPENLTRIFHHGFTTKPNHSGYGLHSAANLSTEMGGKLTAMSDGEGAGASFRLNFPVSGENKEQRDGI
jgi:signal transduction histidine kinase